MQKEFEAYLKDVCRCSPGKKFLLAASGGIDSTVMARLFYEAGMDFEIAHCNFHLRSEESEGDQQFVESMAVEMKKVCHTTHFDTREWSERNGISVQMAARELRYGWFEEIRKKSSCDYISVGHNRDDMVETVLLNLSRGCGLRGLTGIRPRHGLIIRPLLFASRKEIRQYAATQNLAWREDSSNAETKYIRNRIRHVLIPGFESINPAFLDNASKTITRLQQAEILMQLALQEIRQKICISLPDKFLLDIEKLQEFPAAETVLFELLREFGCSSFLVDPIFSSFKSPPGRQFITKTHTITRDRTYLMVTKNTRPADMEVIIEASTEIITSPLLLCLSAIPAGKDVPLPMEPRYAALDRDLLKFPLTLRRWKPGDHFHPLGMKGSKKISDFLIDNKVPLPDKQQIMVIESAGDIIWIVNHRIDDRFRITPSTQNMLLIECVENEQV